MSKKQTQQLPAKDLNNFRQALKLYESKQYKKALKSADAVLKKNPEHGETLAVKGLVLYFMDKKEEGHDYIKKGLSKNLDSYISWHIHGIYHKQERNYEEATKCYVKASQIDPNNLNVVRDLSQLQMQTRHFTPLVTTRKKLLQDKIGFRINWNSVAVAQYFAGDYEGAEQTCNEFYDILKEPLPANDTEDSEMRLFKNHVIYQSGNVERALADLEEIKDKVLDKLAVVECRAKYLQELGRNKEAEREYRSLIKRNPECVAYYLSLEECLGIKEDDTKLRSIFYKRLAEKYPKSDAPKSIPLEFLKGDEFKVAVGEYLKGKLSRGVPSTFVMVKPLYNDEDKKQIIHDFINDYYQNQKENDPSTRLWTIYYMAQHYCHLGDLENATKYIEEAIEHTPTLVELYMTKAKILKHLGDVNQASDVMNHARELDLQDRFVNTKAVKYMLRAGRIDQAIDTLSLFTRNDANGKGVQDLHDMQGLWFLTEQAESYARLGEYGLALKRFHAVVKVFNDYNNDQYDFHYYSPRKGTLRAYLDMISWEDNLYTHPEYVRAVAGAAKIYFHLCDRLENPDFDEFAGMDEAEKKKLLKKQKKERAKEARREQDEKTKSDPDPLGKQLVATKEPLAELEKLWKPLSGEKSVNAMEAWKVGHELCLRQKQYPLAADALMKARNAGAKQHWLTAQAVLSRFAMESDEDAPATLKAVPMDTLGQVSPEGKITEDKLEEYADKHIINDSDAGSVLDYVRVKVAMDGLEKSLELAKTKLPSVLDYSSVTINDALETVELMKKYKLDSSEFTTRAQTMWPKASVF